MTQLSNGLPKLLQSAHPSYSWQIDEYSEYGLLQMKWSIMDDRLRLDQDWLSRHSWKMALLTFDDQFWLFWRDPSSHYAVACLGQEPAQENGTVCLGTFQYHLAFGWGQPIGDWCSSGIVVCCRESHGASFLILGGSHGRPVTFTVGEGSSEAHFFALLSVEVGHHFIVGQL